MGFDTINIEAIKQTPVITEPYPYFIVEQALTVDKYDQVLEDFPSITAGGSFALSQLSYGESFDHLIHELDSPEFRKVIEDKFEIDLSNRPMVVTARGISRQKDGRIHTDSKSKLVTILIYMNGDWQAETGKLRVLYSADDLDNYSAEIAPNGGSLIAFKVTDNCWHGYQPFDGVRRSIQINFVADDAAVKKHKSRHEFTAKLKAFKNSLFG